MNKIKNIIILFNLVILWSCQDDDQRFGNIIAPSNINITAEIVGQNDENPYGDGSGFVNFKASADEEITYNFIFGDGEEEIAPSGEITHRYKTPGTNDYTVQVVASGTGGLKSSTTMDIQVLSLFDNPEAKELLTGAIYDEDEDTYTNSTKTWYWSAAEPGHLGVGPTQGENNYFAQFYQAAPFEKDVEGSDCLYTDELIFTMEEDQMTYLLQNNGQTFFNVSYESIVGGSVGEDSCYDFDTSDTKIANLSPSSSGLADEFTTGTTISLSDDGFMGYYVGASTFEILEITQNRMRVRCIMGNNPELAWYFIFTTDKPDPDAEFETTFNNLIWSDEFDQNGAPSSSNWNYDLGTGNNGWGNGEAQSYTDNSENVRVEDGVLKIIAKAENNGSYTSARIKSENLFEFTYGRVEVRAKLPSGGGTWPAIWMLGANFDQVGWPNCGEIDIMEHVGNEEGRVSSALHFLGNSAGNAIFKAEEVEDVTTEFHTYSVEWREDEIIFLIDDEAYHTFPYANNLPFYENDFFLILNLAMGGTLGGQIDPAFSEAVFEIDYVRVYQ